MMNPSTKHASNIANPSLSSLSAIPASTSTQHSGIILYPRVAQNAWNKSDFILLNVRKEQITNINSIVEKSYKDT